MNINTAMLLYMSNGSERHASSRPLPEVCTAADSLKSSFCPEVSCHPIFMKNKEKLHNYRRRCAVKRCEGACDCRKVYLDQVRPGRRRKMISRFGDHRLSTSTIQHYSKATAKQSAAEGNNCRSEKGRDGKRAAETAGKCAPKSERPEKSCNINDTCPHLQHTRGSRRHTRENQYLCKEEKRRCYTHSDCAVSARYDLRCWLV